MKVYIEAASVARDQVAWFKANGISAEDALVALGQKRTPFAGWDDVYAVIGAAWVQMRAAEAMRDAARRIRRYEEGARA